MSLEFPAVDARAFVEDERYPAYRDSLELYRAHLMSYLTGSRPEARTLDHPTMCRLAGAICGLDFALGLPDVLLKSDPSSNPNLDTP